MRYTKDEINQVIDSSNLIDEISEVLDIKKSGSNYFAICPFHSEDTPSLSINTNKNIWKCFGCGKGGNIISFVMEYKKMDFIKSMNYLIEKYNININIINNINNDNNNINYKEIEEDYQYLYEVSYFYNKNTILEKYTNSLENKYLKNRKISKKTIEKFNLGFSGIELVNKEHPIHKRNSILNNYNYEFQKDRIIIPLIENNKVIGFNGRTINNNKVKYLLSKESNIFKKNNFIYNFDNKNRFEDLFIFEGCFDVFRAFENGISNSICMLGTNINKNHINKLKYFKNIVLCFDTDLSGLNSTYNTIINFLNNNININILMLPINTDFDEFMFNKNEIETKSYIEKNKINSINWLYRFCNFNLNNEKQFNERLNKTINKITNKKFKEELIKCKN